MPLRVALAACLLLAACAAGAPATTPTTATITTTTTTTGGNRVTMDTGDLFLPTGTDGAPLVVLVPGGAWRTADPAGLTDLAATLADAGIAAMTTTVGAAEDGVFYPVPVEDVVCAAAAAASEMTASGVEPGAIVLFGHSTGAHLAALAALVPERYVPACGDPIVIADGLIGVAGTYDVDRVADIAIDLFGVTPTEAPAIWEEGNAIAAAALNPGLPVLLIHGDSDTLVPMSFTDGFADALRAAGHAVTVHVVEGADHHAVYRPQAVAETIIDWVQSL